MNIDKISSQAGFSVTRNTKSTLWDDGIHICSEKPLPFERVACEKELKSFANLIIQECIDFFESHPGCEIDDIIVLLKKHFNMEK